MTRNGRDVVYFKGKKYELCGDPEAVELYFQIGALLGGNYYVPEVSNKRVPFSHKDDMVLLVRRKNYILQVYLAEEN